ncbi:putative Protein Dr1 [Hypsibius exemplaris]|uniref:Protein Dr1 n=1 Tax=Hypsibius exemplaris TaxID=2072580 RepID=A0A1W0WWA7_HYPEX|nr:putative Protein Dr1 [Hypsibius exemplaris]
MSGANDDDEPAIPRAALNKLIKEILPSLRVSAETRDLISACCTEFIHLVASEANDICEKQQRKTITPEHVVEALESLGFGEYRQDAESVMNDCREVQAKRRKCSTKLEKLGIPEDELLRMQQELFAKARLQQQEADHQEWLKIQEQMALSGPPLRTNDESDSDY